MRTLDRAIDVFLEDPQPGDVVTVDHVDPGSGEAIYRNEPPATIPEPPSSAIYLPNEDCLLYLRQALAKGRLNGTAVRVFTRGDSTTAGVLSGTNPNSLKTQNYAWPHRARQLLTANQRLAAPVREYIVLQDAERFTNSGSWGTAGGGTLTFAGDRECDEFHVTLHRGGNAPSITATVDGGEPATITLDQTNNTSKTFVVDAGDLDTHTLVLSSPASGSTGLFGLEQVNSELPDILSIAQIGYSGQRFIGDLNPYSTGSGSRMASLLEPGPHAIFLLMGINDMSTESNTPTEYGTALGVFADAFRAINCDPIFMTFPYDQHGGFDADPWHDAMFQAADDKNVCVVDLASRWGQSTIATSGASTTPATNQAMFDGTHPTLLGYYDIGQMIAEFLGSL